MTQTDHLDDGVIQAIVDGETPGRDVDTHLADCEACASALDERRGLVRRVSLALETVDVPVALERARLAVLERSKQPRGRARRHLARAAILVLAFAGALSAAIPGSPVRAWLATGWHGFTSGFPAETAAVPAAEAGAAAATSAERAGVGIDATAEVRIVVINLPEEGEVSVRLVAGRRAGVYSSAGRYRSGPDLIQVTDPGDEVVVELPRSVPTATVVVDGATYLRKIGDALEVSGPEADSTATEIRFRQSPP